MKMFKVLLTLWSFTLGVESQNIPSRGLYYSNEQNLNPEQLYFTDNRPKYVVNNEQDVKSNIDNNNFGNQKQDQQRVIADTNVNDRYLQYPSHETAKPQLNQNVNANYKQVKQPNTDLRPPYTDDTLYGQQLQATRDPDAIVQDTLRNTTVPQINNVSLAVINFGLNLMRNVNELQAGNSVVSPFSVAMLLALLEQGALGNTQQQISRSLQLSPEVAAVEFKSLIDRVQKRGSLNNILKVANSLFIADAFDLNLAFKRTAINNFGSDVTPVNFAKTNQAVQKINSWVAAKTNNKIESLVTPEIINENTQLVLANAVYFKGLWQTMFRTELTLPREFHLKNGIKKTVPFMRARRIYKTGVDPINNSQVIIVPFQREQYSLVVILPAESSDISSVLTSLTDSQLLVYQNFSPKEAEFELPRFTVRADTNLNPVLRKMGITNIFGQQSELSGIGTYRSLSPQISSALHTAMLSIDEQGGTGAAATAFAVVALSYDDPSVVFKANRPFLAILWDNQLALPLFIAKIEDPLA